MGVSFLFLFMKHKLILPLLSFVPLLLTSCDTGSGKKGEYVPRAINLTERIYAGAGKIRVLGADFVSAFNTSISGTLYLEKNAQTDEIAADIEKKITDFFLYAHALSDRHYNYQYFSDENAIEGTTINNLKVLNASYGSELPVQVEPFLYNLLKESYEFSLASEGKFNMFLGNLNSVYEEKLDEIHSDEGRVTALDMAFMYSSDLVFSSFSETQKERIETLVDSTPKTVDEMNNLLTFDDKTSSITFHRFEGDNNIPVQISLGGNAKGFATEWILDELKEEYPDVTLLINSGFSSIKVIGTRPDGKAWKIRYNNPIYYESMGLLNHAYNTSEVGISNDTEFNLSTSGYYQQYFYEFEDGLFKRRNHIINPMTGYSETFFDQVSVYLNNTGRADMYTTALMNTTSLEEAKALFQKLNEHYQENDAGLILCYKSKVNDPLTHYEYSLDDYDVLSSYRLPILNMKGGSTYEGDYTDLKGEISSVKSKFKPSFQENYMISENIKDNAFLLQQGDGVSYPDKVLAVLGTL